MSRADKPKRHKSIRLDPHAYSTPEAVCSVTIGVRNKAPVFADPVRAARISEVLRDHALKTGVPVYGYCLMPDHVHLVIGPSARCDIVTFVGQFKNLAMRRR